VSCVLLDIAKTGRACLSFFYMPTCPHCGELEPVYEDVATKLSALNKKRPAGSVEVSMIRMNTVRNDVAHFQVCPISIFPLSFVGNPRCTGVVRVAHTQLCSSLPLMLYHALSDLYRILPHNLLDSSG
jgi:hypothetical protein